MRLLAWFLIFSLLSSGYCAAAHAFGNLPVEESAAAMADMPDCHGMPETSEKQADSHPVKMNKMNCKACCASLVGFSALAVDQKIMAGSLKFPVYDNVASSELRYRIFHPPKFFG